MAVIQLTQGKVALIDDEDISLVSQHKWRVLKRTYARAHCLVDGKYTSILLHRLIMNAPPGMEVDHIDGDGLNCVRSNMRLATRSQNIRNSGKKQFRVGASPGSAFKGVSWHKATRKWVARIMYEGKRTSLGYFSSEVDAAITYDIAAKRFFGGFARLNILAGER